MRIVIDLQGAQTASRYRGIGRYSQALAEAMLRQPRGHEFWLVSNGDMEEVAFGALADLLPPERAVRFHSVQPVHWRDPGNAWRRAASEHMREAFLQGLRPDVVHVSSLVEGGLDEAVTSIGVRTPAPFTAATLYDLIPLHDPSYIASDWAQPWYHDKMSSLRRADLLLAISEHVRRDVVDVLSVAPDRVVNISSAASDIFRPVPMTEDLRRQFKRDYGIQGDYLMYSGAMDPRKNLERLLAAYAMLPGKTRSQYQIVISGRLSDIELGRLKLIARRHRIEPDRMVTVGQVSDQALVELYSGAALFVFPSLQEGFGLPVLEAMSCGTAVIGSALTSIPEVIGREDALFDPMDVASIAAAIQSVLGDPLFARELREHGLRQARKFSWASSASRALDAFESRQKTVQEIIGWRAGIAEQEASRAALISELAAVRKVDDVVPEEDLMAAAAAISTNEDVVREVHRNGEIPSAGASWRIEGPFDSSYSLALVNRELARALDGLGVFVALHSTDGAGDFSPDSGFLQREPVLARLHANATALTPSAAAVSSRLLYPPRVSDMTSRLNFLHAYAWEESELPTPWVDDFNEFLQGVSTLSMHVKKVLVDSGVGLPLSVCGAGVDHWDRIPDDGEFPLQARSFRFLHVSSCMPRKGVDVLLQAYGDAFNDADDVSLVIKTFKNPMNDIWRQVEQVRGIRADFPHVVVIECDLPAAQLKHLYRQCHALVAPSRAEGFGLPMAEAMISGLPVITTAWGGQCDFCTEDTAWLVDYVFAPAKTVFDLSDSVWAEPSSEHLAGILREVYTLPVGKRLEKTARGRELLRTGFRWVDVAGRFIEFSRAVSELPLATVGVPIISWIGRFAGEDGRGAGIADLVDTFPDRAVVLAPETGNVPRLPAEVRRCWRVLDASAVAKMSSMMDELRAAVVAIHVDGEIAVSEQLPDLVSGQLQHGRVVIAILDEYSGAGNWSSSFIRALRACDRVLVPDIEGLNMLRRHGVVSNAAILPWHVRDAALDASGARAASRRLRKMVKALVWEKLAHKRGLQSAIYSRAQGLQS
ncbi:glycosyltransferase [Pseudoxanthomonas sp.]|uniref:glycosyltransferase n=1 Tax=Pseudoxanthomonas sp. TaxID=1871049 RepID=UPI00262D81A0|nr:glycosyltransferase [Pseudoxanthomonas sp.]WDS35632.1 MAG: glycosyltransferase [Pseudoxanthomonas sp.]